MVQVRGSLHHNKHRERNLSHWKRRREAGWDQTNSVWEGFQANAESGVWWRIYIWTWRLRRELISRLLGWRSLSFIDTTEEKRVKWKTGFLWQVQRRFVCKNPSAHLRLNQDVGYISGEEPPISSVPKLSVLSDAYQHQVFSRVDFLTAY